MGAVISPIFSEFHLQYIEHKCSVDIAWWCHISGYVWYVVDIFIITYGSNSNISYVFREYNIFCQNVILAMESETDYS